MNRDFLGPIPNKKTATLRVACVADVKQAFDECAGALARGRVNPTCIHQIANKLGFPLGADQNSPKVRAAIQELDPTNRGHVTFAEVLNFWNNHKDAKDQERAMRDDEIEDNLQNLAVPIRRLASVPSLFGKWGSEESDNEG